MVTELADEHPELFHYTGINGLEGIVKSQTLWATHASFLNDTTEINAFKSRLPHILRPEIKNTVEELNKIPADQALIKQRGGTSTVIDEFTTDITNHIYDALLDTQMEPYIASFCTSENEQIKQHGLLSQWRGYGQEGGYVIVFDTSRLVNLMKQEGSKWGYSLIGADVVYSPYANEKFSDEGFHKELDEDIDIISSSISDFLKTNSVQYLDNIYEPFVRCACRYKHWGFHEEKEVRIIAILHARGALDEQKSQGQPLQKEKERHHFVRGANPVPCIHLFDGITQLPDNPLPITRIIVGPHRDKDKRQYAVESLLSQYQLNIPVSVSKIPYVGNR
jgi:hypothetical protein